MKNIAAKLLAIQKEIQPIEKTETNPFFKSKYFDVNGVIAALRPILNKHGVVVIQPMTEWGDHMAINTIAIDADTGEEIKGVTILPDISDPQKAGAMITYFRRYALQSFFLLEAEDDDGNTASGVQNAPQARTAPLTPTGTRKVCVICNKEYNPRPGTEAWSTNCYECYRNGLVPPKVKPPVDSENSSIPF